MSDQDPAPPLPDAEELNGLQARAEALERQIAELERETQARLVLAELKSEALRAGMIDLDGLKLLDLSHVKLNARGEVDDASALMGELKRQKPWLFGSRLSSSRPASPPSAELPRQKRATEMTDDEYRAARAALLKRRG
ncbi:MAG: hypothetical protein ACREF3_03440 [Acetobacteraceae bacterium]